MTSLLKSLIILSSLFGQAGDNAVFEDASITIVSRTSRVELTVSLPRTYYRAGDTIKGEISIRCLGDNAILVVDPDFFSTGYYLAENEIRVSIGTSHTQNINTFSKLIKIEKHESVNYPFDIVVDSSLVNAGLIRYYIVAAVRYTPYSEELEYMTLGDEAIVWPRDPDHETTLELYTERPWIGGITIFSHTIIDRRYR